MTNEVSLQSKIQIVMHPPMPATCCVCNKSADGIVRFLDFQLSLDYYGAVVICEDCGKELLTVLDFVPVDLLEAVQGKLEVAQNKLDAVRSEEQDLRNALNSILRVRPDLASPIFLSETSSSDLRDNDEANAEANRQFDTTESGFDESDSEWGSEDSTEFADTDSGIPDSSSKD